MAAVDGVHVAAPAPPFAIGARVYVPRSRGQYESVAYVLAYDAGRGLVTVEVDSRGSGVCKVCTADLLSTTPLGEQWAARFQGAIEVA